ncbi:hypothetical protein [Sorangium sp. So ce363]|uniref:hypothetical protein n=1 Tax=Sorangium sp. So ce363 TaxID=3133304 RepID=UPI003F5E895B
MAIAAALALGGCKRLKSGAKEEFRRAHSCPDERIEIRERPDLAPYTVSFGTLEPPEDVRADPGRLKVWKEEHKERVEGWNDAHDVFEARGCGKQVLMTCGRPNVDGTADYSDVVCTEDDYPPDASRW